MAITGINDEDRLVQQTRADYSCALPLRSMNGEIAV